MYGMRLYSDPFTLVNLNPKALIIFILYLNSKKSQTHFVETTFAGVTAVGLSGYD